THIAQQRPLLQSSLRACIGASPSWVAPQARRHGKSKLSPHGVAAACAAFFAVAAVASACACGRA
ncbi:unnamed protein product, partial [Urochloa humidicola]